MAAEKKEIELTGGRSVIVTSTNDGRDGQKRETVEFRADGGDVELRVRMTADGPVVELSGARVEINAAETISMSCKELTINASEKLKLGSEGTVEVESTDDLVLRGKMIHLN